MRSPDNGTVNVLTNAGPPPPSSYTTPSTANAAVYPSPMISSNGAPLRLKPKLMPFNPNSASSNSSQASSNNQNQGRRRGRADKDGKTPCLNCYDEGHLISACPFEVDRERVQKMKEHLGIGRSFRQRQNSSSGSYSSGASFSNNNQTRGPPPNSNYFSNQQNSNASQPQGNANAVTSPAPILVVQQPQQPANLQAAVNGIDYDSFAKALINATSNANQAQVQGPAVANGGARQSA